jgi:tetratricopeptide (TPR) repeat protein
VAWSYGLLSRHERDAFDRLSVFAGAFSAEAAHRVAGAGDGLLRALVDKSMVVVERHPVGTRYRLLETLRAYGRARLSEDDRQRGQAAHAAFFRWRTWSDAERLRGGSVGQALAAITADLDEVRTALAWSTEHDLDLALDLVAALVDYVELQLPSEVFGWAEQAVGAADASGRTSPAMPLVLAVVASGARFRGDLAAARTLAQRSLDLTDGPDDPRRRFPLYLLCELRLFDGDLDRTAELAGELEEAAQAAGDAFRVSLALVCRALALAYGGQVGPGAALATSSRERAERAGDLVGAAWSRYAEGETRIDSDPERALGLLERALREARDVGDRYLTGVVLVSRASLLGRWHDPSPAREAFRLVIEHWHQSGDWTHQWTTLRSVVALLVRLERDEAAARLLGALGSRRSAALPFGSDADRLTAARTTLSERLGPPRLVLLEAEGAGWSDEEAVLAACAALW